MRRDPRTKRPRRHSDWFSFHHTDHCCRGGDGLESDQSPRYTAAAARVPCYRVRAEYSFGGIHSLPRGPMAETFEAYRTRVLSYLGDEEPIGVQQATPSQLDRRLRGVAPAELIRRPAPEKWSIAEILAHLADAELAMGWRLRNMLANPGVALTWWDQAVWAERLGSAQQDASLSAGVFRALRESNLRLLQSVPRARWVECYGVHELRGRQTVEEFVRLEAAHDLNHLRQIDHILNSGSGAHK